MNAIQYPTPQNPDTPQSTPQGPDTPPTPLLAPDQGRDAGGPEPEKRPATPPEDTTELDEIASTLVIPSHERAALEARENADPDAINDAQDEYHTARMDRARKQQQRKRERDA